jgi:hypothetical protein
MLGGRFSVSPSVLANDEPAGADHIITFTREGYEEMGCDVFE